MGNRVHRLLAAALILIGAVLASAAAAQTWIPVGPPGGDVRSLAADPRDAQRIYLGTADGILYRSDDGGLHWGRLTPGFPLRGCSLDDIVVNQDGVVLVGYWEVMGRGGGVARSYDDGQTFKLLKGIEGESVRALAVAPSDPWVVAAGTLSGVFLSRDLGNRWARITPAGDPADTAAGVRNLQSLAFDPIDPAVVYAGTVHLGWKTTDGGSEWLPVHDGMIEDSHVMTLTVDARNPRLLYATACTGIYRSTDGAQHWTKLRGIPDASRRTRAFCKSDDGRLLLAGTTQGFWISEDGGRSWRQATSSDLVVNAVLLQPDDTILLGTEGAGVLKSRDLGRTWTAINCGFSERFVSRIVFDAADQRVLAAVYGDLHHGGVFVSSGDGDLPDVNTGWTRLGNGLDGRQVLSLALLGRTLLAGTDDGIFVRPPSANAWKRLSTRLDAPAARLEKISKADSATADSDAGAHPRVTDLVTLASGGIVAGTPRGVLSSADGGSTWRLVQPGASPAVLGLAVSPDDGDVIIAATASGFFRSADGGAGWTLVAPALNDVTLHTLAFLPSSGRVLFATTSGGLYRSGNQGVTWFPVNGGLPRSDLTGIAIDPGGRTMYVSGFTWGGIFRSADAGRSWKRMPTDGLASDHVWTLGLDPASPDRLLAASPAGGLHLFAPASTAEHAEVSGR